MANRLIGVVVTWGGWLLHLGGVGLIVVGIIDQSFFPLPGGQDMATILLASSQPEKWFYFALMATVGAVSGAYISFAIARKGGKETLEKKLPRGQIEKIESKFSKHGFAAVFLPCFLPPPLPTVAFVAGAGALQYPRRKFLLAITTGRALRYLLIAYFAQAHGKTILSVFQRYRWIIIAVFVLFILGATVGGFWLRRRQMRADSRSDQKRESEESQHRDSGLQQNKSAAPVYSDPQHRRAG
jgi:membrane protein DedA with SNARE-associated domain